MTSGQVVEMLDQTVDWYRLLGMQQQAATQPSDLLILYANRQAAEQVMAISFEIARANAELLSSEADVVRQRAEDQSRQSLQQTRRGLDEQRAALQAQIASAKAALASAPRSARSERQARIDVLQGRLDLINARRNLLTSMSRFEWENDTAGFGANALKAHIDAVAASIPAEGSMPMASAADQASKPVENGAAGVSLLRAELGQYGIWDLASTVMRLRGKARMIETVDGRTAQLEALFDQLRAPPQERLKQLAAQGDALSTQSADAGAPGLRGVRDQYDTLAWLFQQTSAMVTPLSKVDVLLGQYRSNLANWSDVVGRQLDEAWRALAMRLALFIGLLVLVLAGAHLWRRAVYRYVQDARRRSRYLLLNRIVVWCLVAAIAVFTFATEIGSLATFAGLITAGLAVAMQSVLVSVVGYFFLVGKYGVRVGDRVQIGNVVGEVVDLGLVRLHLLELKGEDSHLAPSGRVVAFANSVVFQASGGLFRQIPGIDLAWHEVNLVLPPDADPAAAKQRLVETINAVLADYQDDMLRQAQAMGLTSMAHGPQDVQPQVQLRFAPSGVEAMVRYPVTRQASAEIDERVSRELLAVVSG